MFVTVLYEAVVVQEDMGRQGTVVCSGLSGTSPTLLTQGVNSKAFSYQKNIKLDLAASITSLQRAVDADIKAHSRG